MIDQESVVLVTGATGFTGQYVVNFLNKTGCTIKAIRRPASYIEPLSDIPVQWITGNIYDQKVVSEACEKVTHIIHMAAAYRSAGISDDEYFNTHVEGTKLLINEAKKVSGFRKFVHVSTVGVLGHIENPPADETAEYNPGDLYQKSKAEAEKWLVSIQGELPFPVTIVRPAAIYGPGDRRLLKLFKLARLPVIPLIGFTRGLYHLIHVEDLARFCIHCLSDEKTDSQIYICGSPNATSIREMISWIAESDGRKPLFVNIPAWPVFVLADIVEWVCKALNIEPILYRRRIAFFTKDRAFLTNKLMELKSFSLSKDDRLGIQELNNWYKSKDWL